MAESENTTSPPGVSRRGVLAGAVAFPLASSGALLRPGASPPEADPVLQIWRDWQKAHTEAQAWCRKLHRLEKRLLRTVGFPCVRVPVPGEHGPVYAFSPEGIDNLLGRTAHTRALRKRLRADLAAHQARWDEAAKAIGFDRVDASYNAVEARWQDLADILFATPALSFPGIAARLALVVGMGEAKRHDPDFPWPQIRSVLADLLRVAGLDEPALRV